MKPFLAIYITLLAVLLQAQRSTQDSVNALITKLGSQNSAERQAATKSLQNRPEVAPAVRAALRSPDPEIARRAALILDHYDGRPSRELEAAFKNGDVLRAVKLMADWPAGKNEDEMFAPLRSLVRTLADRNRKQTGKNIQFDADWPDQFFVPDVIVGRPRGS